MLVLSFTDLHIHNYQAFDKDGSRLANCLEVLTLVFKFAHKHKIEFILFSGDLYDNQKALPTEVVNLVIEKFAKLFATYPHITFIAISGNHDHASKNLIKKEAVTALTHLDLMFDNFKLIDNTDYPLDDNGELGVIGVPYYEHSEDYHKALEKVLPLTSDYQKVILLSHQTPSGLNNPNIPFDTNVHNELYESFDLVLNGHIHAFQEITPKFINVGSPLHRDLGDLGVDKGFLIIETDAIGEEDFYKFVSTKGKFPEFECVKLKEGEELKKGDFNYLVPIRELKQALTLDVNVEEFGGGLTDENLVRNFWKKVSKDEALLFTGLKFLKD